MDWIFEHIQLLIVIGGTIAYWLNQRRQKKLEEEEELRQEPREMPTAPERQGDDPSEHVRRIQEEIRRRILERAGGSPVLPPPLPTAPAPVPVYREEVREVEGQEGPVGEVRRSGAMDDMDAAETQRQSSIQDQLRRLEEKRRDSRDLVAQARAESAAVALMVPPPKPDNFVAELRDPKNLRRAIVLREILGPPVSIR